MGGTNQYKRPSPADTNTTTKIGYDAGQTEHDETPCSCVSVIDVRAQIERFDQLALPADEIQRG